MTQNVNFSPQPKLFALSHSLDGEMKKFSSLMQANPEKGKTIFKMGSELVQNATNGNFRKFCQQCGAINEDFPVAYFGSKSLELAMLHQHFMIANFIIDQGYPINNTDIPNSLINCIKNNMEDYGCAQLIDFLATKKYDFNMQEPKSWFSPLHYAVDRGLLLCVERLIFHGADVNVVAENDIMPLTLALRQDLVDKDPPAYHQIQDILLRKGAKSTWKRQSGDKKVSFSGGFHTSAMESTSVGVKGQGKVSVETSAPALLPAGNTSTTTVFRSFRGGGDVMLTSIVEEPKLQVIAEEVDGSNESEEGGNKVVLDESNDGAFLFSTG